MPRLFDLEACGQQYSRPLLGIFDLHGDRNGVRPLDDEDPFYLPRLPEVAIAIGNLQTESGNPWHLGRCDELFLRAAVRRDEDRVVGTYFVISCLYDKHILWKIYLFCALTEGRISSARHDPGEQKNCENYLFHLKELCVW